MKFLKSLFSLAVILIFAGCTNFKKIYKDGSVASGSFYADVNFETKLDLILLPVEIEGETFRFLFDTGAPNVISKELSEKLGSENLGNGNVGDSQGNRDRLRVVKLDSVFIGGVRFYNTAAVVADLHQAVEIGCLGIDGILGANLMRFAYWKIDAKNQVLSLSSNLDTLKHGLTNGHILKFEPRRTFTPIVSLTLNDSLINYFTYDTGSGGYITLGRNMSLNADAQLAEYCGYGSAGLYGSKLDTIRYGSIDVSLDEFSQKGIASYSTETSKKLVGMEFLGQFVQVLDWQNNEITLYEDEIVGQRFDRFPVIPRWVDGSLIIGGLNTDASYRDLGLSIGDSIKTVNELNFQNGDASLYCDLINRTDSIKGDTLSVELTNGKKHNLTRVSIALE